MDDFAFEGERRGCTARCDGNGGVGVHAPLEGRAGIGDVVLEEDLGSAVEETKTTFNGGAVVGISEVGGEEGSGGFIDGRYCGRVLDGAGASIVGLGERGKDLVLLVDDDGVLAFSSLAVVEPSVRVGVRANEVSLEEIDVNADYADTMQMTLLTGEL